MSSLLAVRLGAQLPTIQHSPPDVVSLAAAEEAIELADAYGVADGCPLSESQKITLRNGLGERSDGSWAATRIADFGPRQGTGKNDKIAARELAGLLLYGEQLQIHTAHEFPTANESFLRLVAVFEAWDDLRRKVSRIRYANGEQGIELRTGQRLKYRARTGGSGRGFAKADLLVYDEAQHLGAEHVAASGPAKLANPNSQTWYAGSGGLTTSLKAWDVRRQAILGLGGRLAYTEMTGETVSVDGGKIKTVRPDALDRDVWYRCIPGLGRWVTEEGVEALYDELGEDLFLREILCVWDGEPDDTGGLVETEAWARLSDNGEIVGPPSIALDVSPDRRYSAFGVAGLRSDGRTQVETADHRPGTGWVLERGCELACRWGVPIRIESGSPAASFIEPLRASGVQVTELTSGDHARALGRLLDEATSDRLRHLGDGRLATAVRNAELRHSGDAEKLARRSSKADITTLVAVTLALGGVAQSASEPLFAFS